MRTYQATITFEAKDLNEATRFHNAMISVLRELAFGNINSDVRYLPDVWARL